MKTEFDNILIQISRNGMEAYLTIIFNKNNEEELRLTVDNVLGEVRKKVNYGLREELIKEIINNKRYNEKVCIAKGRAPKNGTDGKIRYYFDVNKKMCPKIKDDGSVDYRELDIVNNVKKDDLLAEIIPPKEGEIGYKVTGEEIDYKKGRTPFLNYGKGVELSSDGLRFYASQDGMVKLLNKRISVLDILEVPAVDNSTGNVYFNGTVIVKGNVINGFRLKADGDIEVKGVVEGAFLENEGDILIRRGIQGYSKADIYTKGRLTTRFIENSFIKAEDTITAEAIMHSEVESLNSIDVVGKRGLIVGGICKARKLIRAKTVGSSMATITVLQIGADSNLKQKHNKFVERNDELENNLEKVNKSIRILETMIKSGKADYSKAQLYDRLINTKDSLEKELYELNNKLSIIKRQIDSLSSGKIRIEGIVYPGVRIIIGDEMKIIKDELEHCSFYLDDGEIKVGPY